MTQEQPDPTPADGRDPSMSDVGAPPTGSPPSGSPPASTASSTGTSGTALLTPAPEAAVTAPERPAPAAAGRLVLGASTVAGLATAAVLPFGPAGVGWLLSAVVAAAATVVVVRRAAAMPAAMPAGSATSAASAAATATAMSGVAATATRTGGFPNGARPGLVRTAWALAALALVAVGTVRAAHWLFVLCVPAAAVCGSLAVVSGRRCGRGRLAADAVAVPIAAVACLPWLARGLSPLPRTVPDAVRAARMALSVGVAVMLLVLFGALFSGADATFAGALDDVLPKVDGGSALARTYLFAMAGVGTAGASYLLTTRPSRTVRAARVTGSRLRLAEWALPVGLLVVLFGAFVVSQLVVLFGGSDYVRRTGGLTYAEYARSGFWQLLTVTVLTLVVIGAALRWAQSGSPTDRVWLRGLLGALAGLTLVVVASALARMWFYQQAYGFTVLRLFVEAVELWLGVVYLLVVAAVLTLRTRPLPRAILATGVAALLLLAALSPDRFVAEHNIARWERTGVIDVHYLSGLSADAAPALGRLPEPLRSCALSPLADRLRRAEGWRSWNLGRAAARTLTTTVSEPLFSDCRTSSGQVRSR